MWKFRECERQLIQLEERLARAERTNECQNKVLQKNQKYLFLVMGGLCLSLTLHFSVQSMQDHDRQFLYDLLRFVMAASGVGVVAKVSQMPK
jgi:hypothetical protein